MDLQFLLDRYKWELDRKDKISMAVNFPVTMLILITGLLGALLPKLQLVAPRVVLVAAALFLAAGICGIVSLFWFVHAYRGSTYMYLPLLSALDGAREEWRQFYEYAKADRADEDFFEHEFRGRIIEAADTNTRANDRRQGFLDRGNIALVWMLIATALCGAIAFLSVLFKS